MTDPGGQKTYGSYGSGILKNVRKTLFSTILWLDSGSTALL